MISHQIATGSNDDNLRIWDIRSLKAVYTIPAHTSSVSDVRFFRASNQSFQYPFTLDLDSKERDAKRLAAAFLNGTLKQEEEEVEESQRKALEEVEVEVEVPLSGMYLASCGYDGYVKLWSADDWQLVKALSSEAGGKVMSVDISRGEKPRFYFFCVRVKERGMGDGLDQSDIELELMKSCEFFFLDGRFMASGEWTRTFKLWSAENVML